MWGLLEQSEFSPNHKSKIYFLSEKEKHKQLETAIE